MVLTKTNLKLENSGKISLIFEDNRNDFKYFEDIFRSMREIDSLHSVYYTDLKGKRTNVKSEVFAITMKSPTWIDAFISEYWFETLLFIWGSYDRMRPNAQMIIEDVVKLCNTIDEKIAEIDTEVKDYSYEKIHQLVDWYNRLTLRQKERVLKIIKRVSVTLDNLKKIIF